MNRSEDFELYRGRTYDLGLHHGGLMFVFSTLWIETSDGHQNLQPYSHEWHYRHWNSCLCGYGVFMNAAVPLDAGRHVSTSGSIGEYRIDRQLYLCLPPWLVWVISLCLAVLWSFIAKRFLRRPINVHQGLCSNCGYDLSATPERCPECGLKQISDALGEAVNK